MTCRMTRAAQALNLPVPSRHPVREQLAAEGFDVRAKVHPNSDGPQDERPHRRDYRNFERDRS